MMLFSKRRIGDTYEALAKRHLLGQGLSFIEHSFNTKFGEIDLIMKEGTTIVFVEVKYRDNERFGNAAEFVTQNKIVKLRRTANVWLKMKNLSPYNTEYRFDVVAIHAKGQQINWIKNAITEG